MPDGSTVFAFYPQKERVGDKSELQGPFSVGFQLVFSMSCSSCFDDGPGITPRASPFGSENLRATVLSEYSSYSLAARRSLQRPVAACRKASQKRFLRAREDF